MFPIIFIGFVTTGISGFVSYNLTTFLINIFYEEKLLKQKILLKKEENKKIFNENLKIITENYLEKKKFYSIPKNIKWNSEIDNYSKKESYVYENNLSYINLNDSIKLISY